MRVRLITIPVLVVAAVLGWGEAISWRASRRELGEGMPHSGREAVVVLGFGNKPGRANFVNRYRVRAGIRSLSTSTSVLVLCGGAVAGAQPEADIMAGYARDERDYTGPMLIERESTTTWENIRNAIGLIEPYDTIKIVSDPLHAQKGRRYLWMLRPDLAARLVRGRDYRFGELILLKPVAAVVGLVGLRRARRSGPR
ncbi:YdcF family protein [Microbacterium protaetiae]|uniref:YdcF family protein n=1 Tax=Microbacterium protaetiae TaxID=2509458 RepID=UPI001F5DA305|nr:YdcF family protein [Microbacterium protaetiae]